MPLFRNHYRCYRCGSEWDDVWSATCDDDCPSCGARHNSPVHSEDEGDEPASADEAQRQTPSNDRRQLHSYDIHF